jgi:phosphoribosyl 1,2-cyclic phosphodiesterase
MQTFSIQSGSNGNCIYVEANGTRLLFDAGVSGNCTAKRMAQHGRDIRDVQGVIISHDHIDHIQCCGILQRKFGIPIYATRKTLAATNCRLGRLSDVRHFESGDTLEFGHVRVHTIRTPHDAVDGVAFVVECESKKLGILTDLGHPFPGLCSLIEDLDAAYLESNYDPHMLEYGTYSEPLKDRIRGNGGHISNNEAAALLKSCTRNRPKWIAVAHLSEENNRPQLAHEAQYEAVGRDYPVYHASRYDCSPMLSV